MGNVWLVVVPMLSLYLLTSVCACASQNQDCTSHYRKYCVEGRLYWQNSCADYEEIISVCACGCADDFLTCRSDCTCTPDCTGKECGSDGCFSNCPPGCDAGEDCNAEGLCEPACVPESCADINKECGYWPKADGCGGDLDCDDCQYGEICDVNGRCQPLSECVHGFGGSLTQTFGRLDGFLHYVVLPDDYQCPNDDNHVRLQVRMNGQYYDVPVNIEATGNLDPKIYHYDLYADLYGEQWNEGWHTTGVDLDYYYDLGVTSSSFSGATLEELSAMFENEIVAGGRISVFMEAFDNSGGHNVHRNNYFSDGAIVINPQTNPHYYLFRFSDQSF